MSEWISVEEAAAKYGINKEVIWLWADMKRFPMSYEKGITTVDEESLIGFLHQNKDRATAEYIDTLEDLCIEKANINSKEIKGIGVTSFANGVVFLDKNGNTIAPGCFSQDYRANEILELYKKEGTYDKINEIVKGTLFAGEPGPILRWYKEHEREIYDKIGGVLLFKDYIMYRLTQVFATDLNVFGGSFMIDMNTMEYSKELLNL